MFALIQSLYVLNDASQNGLPVEALVANTKTSREFVAHVTSEHNRTKIN